MRRRTFLFLAGTAVPLALLWTRPAWAQTKIARVGILFVNDARKEPFIETFRGTLRENGWVEGKNVTFEFRDAAGDPRRLAGPAAELVRLKVDVLFPIGPPAVRAAFAATRDIPIVAHDLETDPVTAGYAQSYSRPGGNLTGLFLDSPDLAGKWVEFLKDVVPGLSRAVVLFDSTSGPLPLQSVRSVAPSLGVKLQVLEIKTPQEIDQAPSAFRGRPQAMIVLPSPMMYVESARLAQIAKKARLPATSMFVPFAEAGGMIAFGPELPATFERCAALVAKVLGGAKPGDLPVERPIKFEFVLNLKAARELHLTVPDSVMLRANRVIR